MTDQSMREAIDEVWALFKETDARLDQQHRETEAMLAREHAKTEAQFRETDERLRKLDALFTGQWGKMLEALVKPGALRLFQEWVVDVRHTYQRPEAQINGHTGDRSAVGERVRGGRRRGQEHAQGR